MAVTVLAPRQCAGGAHDGGFQFAGAIENINFRQGLPDSKSPDSKSEGREQFFFEKKHQKTFARYALSIRSRRPTG
jgi:hypothetical protein